MTRTSEIIILFIALMISTSSLLVSLKSFLKTLRFEDNLFKTHLMIDEILQTVKLNIECNMKFCDYIKEQNDGHTVRSNRTTKKTRRTSDK
jgi:hypothetical protein